MTRPIGRTLLGLALVVLAFGARAEPQENKDAPPPLPPPREIPGITASDAYPRSCVDCHVVYPELKRDERLSTLMKTWTEAVDPKLLAAAQVAMPAGVKLKGRHPAAPGALKNPPASCVTCHGPTSKTAPPFSRMIHVIHLTGGKDNVFLTVFRGECTHCHKLDPATGSWTMPGGPEK